MLKNKRDSCFFLKFLKKIGKKSRKWVDFLQIGDKLMIGTDFCTCWGLILSSLYRLFQQKKNMNPPSFTISTFAARNEMPAQEDCVFVSCWAFLCTSQERVLGRTFIITHGERPAFLSRHTPQSERRFYLRLLCSCSMVHTVSVYQLPGVRSSDRHRHIFKQSSNLRLKQVQLYLSPVGY